MKEDQQRPVRILAVDDDPRICRGLTRHLSDFPIQTATTGIDALNKLGSFAPDIVILDVQMPDMTGLELCERIRENPQFRFIKVLFISGMSHIEDRLAGYMAGGDDYITKPFEPNELLAKIRVLSRLKATEEIDDIKNEFMTLISHETRTPLVSISGFCELILEDENLPLEKVREFVKRIKGSTDRLADLAESTLMACDLKDKTSVMPSQVMIDGLISRGEDSLKEKIEEKELELSKEIESEIIQGDGKLLQRAICGVLEHAISCSPTKGKLVVTGVLDDQNYKITITDEGEALTADFLNKAFDYFISEDIMHHHSGLGMNLALADRIARLHRGTFEICTLGRNGNSYVLTIPVSQ